MQHSINKRLQSKSIYDLSVLLDLSLKKASTIMSFLLLKSCLNLELTKFKSENTSIFNQVGEKS
jgi:hypothetical protein